MYNLAPRFPKKTKTSTPENIAPNTYIICDGKDSRINYVPFLSGTERKASLRSDLYTHALYHPEEEFRPKIKGGASLQNRAKRLVYSKSDSPGPGDYDPETPKEGCKYKPPPCHGKGRLYVCRVPYSLLGSAPSVPTHVDINSYDIDINGNIVKVQPYEHDRTLGPAFYHIRRGDFCFTTRRYHQGCQWSKSKTKRGTIKISDSPPPNLYDVNDNPCRCDDKDENYRALARLFTFAPRFTENEMMKAAREDLPGPGQYNITSSIGARESMSIVPRPFVVGAKRLDSGMKSATPGPADYEICDCSTMQKQFSIKDVPFGFNSSRFSKKKSENLPGPSTYDIKGSIDEKIYSKRNKYSNVDAPFFKTAERKIGFVARDARFLPGPGEYDVEDTEVEKQDINASVFKSRTQRLKYGSSSEEAEPASYNISEPFNKNRNRTSHYTGKVPFQSSQLRMPQRKTRNPGPADYIGQLRMGDKGLSFNTSPRFKCKDNGIPPPATYTLHPSLSNPMYKAVGTHNLRLKESVMRTKLRLPPGATWQNWAREMQKTKKLRWFSKPTSDYRHCAGAT